jgi:DNA polymerase-3 subunit delta
MIAKADLELRSSPADKRLVLERLVMRLSAPKVRVEAMPD